TDGTCGPTGPTGADGKCTVIVSSTVTGTSSVHASGTVTVGGVAIAVATNGYGAHDVSNGKTWVDARITIGTTGVNQVGDPHTFTVSVEKNDGTGWSDAAGVTINSTSTGVGSITGGTCGPTGPTNAVGDCTIIVNSNVAGIATVNASGTVTVGGVSIGVATDGYGAFNVSNQKTWVSPPPPPPPLPPPPTIDLSITKTDSPDPVNVGQTLTYTLTIRNNGPSTATQVRVADSLPPSVTYLSSSSTQGTCTGSGQLVQCTIGTMAVNATVTVTITVRPLQPGSILNVATVVGAEAETNTANNRAEAPTLVVAPFKPPPAVCPTLTVQSRTLLVGKKGTIRAVVSLRGKGVAGVRVIVRGPGISKSGVSDSRGRVSISVRPARVGIVTLRVTNQPGACATRRIGVVGVFKPPPVTG
ncbi:MAG: DUF11 domain-containing protein, partial [Actinobacteria bacterium]|nr:DUF11 domain-containing protein [Actinomycetota bacterium]